MWQRQGTNRLFYLLAALAAMLALAAQAEEHSENDAEMLVGQLSGPRRCNHIYCADEVQNHGGRVKRQPVAAGPQLSGPRKCMSIRCADEPEDQGMRVRRQIVQPQQPLASPPSPSGGSDIFGFLSNLGPQVDSAQSSMKLFSSLFNSSPQQANSVPQAGGPQQQQQSALASLAPLASQLMSQISSLTRSTQSSSKELADGAAQQVQSAQTGLQGALTEMMSGFQRIVSTNPTLLPEVKNLYQRVSSRLSSQVQPSPAPVPTGQSINDAIAAQMGR